MEKDKLQIKRLFVLAELTNDKVYQVLMTKEQETMIFGILDSPIKLMEEPIQGLFIEPPTPKKV